MQITCPICQKSFGLMKLKKEVMCPFCGRKLQIDKKEVKTNA